MARSYRNVYSGADFVSKFGGTQTPVVQRQEEEADYTRQRHQYDLGHLAEQERQDSLNSAARNIFGNAWSVINNDTTGTNPLTIARDYTTHAAKLKTYMEGGEYEKGYAEYKILAEAKSNGGDMLFGVASTDPRRTGSSADAELQTGAQYIARGEFGALPVKLWNGETVTADDIYRDGNTYKKYEMGNRLTQNFTKDLVDAATGDDEFSRKIAHRISSPVTSPDGNGNGGAYRLQFRDLGDYVFGNGEFEKLRDELGDQGTERLVEDALTNGITDGTFRDRMDFVRDVVFQQKQANPDKDLYRLVRDNLDAFNRRVKALPTIPGVSDETMRRGVSKLMTMAAEEAPDAIDFDDERTNARLDSWSELMMRSEQFGIPLLVDSHEAGMSIRKALRDSLSYQSIQNEPDETNALTRFKNAFNLASSIVSAGSVPFKGSASTDASALGFTSEDQQLDSAMKTMVSDVLKDHLLPKMYRGMREDVALRSLTSDPDARVNLARSWGDAISIFTGLSADAGRYVASSLVRKAFKDDGSVTPVDLKSELSAAAFDKNTPESVAVGLRRYIKSKNLVDDTRVNDLLVGYRRMLSDPLIGWGMSEKNMIDASMADMKHRVVSVLEKGQNPRTVADAAAKHGFPYKWTGKWMLPDGSVVSNEGYEKGQYQYTDEAGRVRTGRFNKKTAVPVIDKELTLTNLDSTDIIIPAYGGQGEIRLPSGSWSGNESGYLTVMSYMRNLYQQQQKLQNKRVQDAAKASGGPNSGGINIGI